MIEKSFSLKRPNEDGARLAATLLRGVAPFSALPDGGFECLAPALQLHPLRVRATLLVARSFANRVGCVLSGAFRLVAITPRAAVMTLSTLGPGDMLGVSNALLGMPPGANLRLIAERTGDIASLPHDQFVALARAHTPFAAALLSAQAKALADAHTRLFEVAGLDVRGRLIGELLNLAGDARTRTTIEPSPTHMALAAQIAASREAVSRQLAGLEKAGLIGCQRGVIEIFDICGLEALYHAASGGKLFQRERAPHAASETGSPQA